MEKEQGEEGRGELVERLRALETPESSATLAELSYRRAREALEKAVEEARAIRLAALDDARTTRERELTALMQSLRAMRISAEGQVSAIIAEARLQADQVRARARQEAEELTGKASEEAALARANADAVRSAADQRAREVERLEAEFNTITGRFAARVGLSEQPAGGWLKHLFGTRQK